MAVTVALETHGKAVIVKGDTRPIKDFLKEQGGKWNGKLGGWIYQGSKRSALLDALNKHSAVGTVVDKTGNGGAGGGGAAPSKASSAAPAPSVQTASTRDAVAGPSDDAELPEGNVEGDGVVFPIGDKVQVTVRASWKKAGVDIRKFYCEAGSTELRATAKGIWMNAEDWHSLRKSFEQIDAMTSKEAKTVVGKDIVATVKPGGMSGTGGQKAVDIRRNYVDKSDGELKPTKKGCFLQAENWSKLKSIAAKVSEAVLNDDGSRPEKPPRKKQRTAAVEEEEEEPKEAQGTISSKKIKKQLAIVLKGRDLSSLTPKIVRAELESKMSLEQGALESRKEEIKGMIADMLQQG